jgi:hypothetical protein
MTRPGRPLQPFVLSRDSRVGEAPVEAITLWLFVLRTSSSAFSVWFDCPAVPVGLMMLYPGDKQKTRISQTDARFAWSSRVVGALCTKP